LAELSLRLVVPGRAAEVSLVVLEKTGPLDARFPRAVGRPARRPLWS
jgi:hypothetical protein